MKPGLYPIVLAGLLFLLVMTRSSSASPRQTTTQEDALADGDVDPEDIAVRSPFASVAGATSGRPVLGAPSGSAWISLVGFSRKTIDDRQETGGYLVLGLPLDRFAKANTRVTTVSSVEMQQPFELALSPRLARSCVAAAWRAAGIGADEARLDAIVSRARWSAALPEARLRAVRFEDARLSLDTGTETSKLRDSAGANVGFEARLTWRLDRLLYADDEPAFERIRLEHRDARARIGAKVLEALFHWQRAALDLRSLPPDQQGTRDEADVRLRLMEAEAALDVLTNGWFAKERGQRPPRYAAPVPTDL